METKKNTAKLCFEIFLSFLKMGCLTFGGGYAMLPVAERELVKKRGWATMDEIMDYYTIAQITPGVIAVNLSTFVGCKQKGPLGGIVATIGFVLPGITLITAAAFFIKNIAEIPEVRRAFAGIRVAVGALVLDTVIKMVKGVIKDPLKDPRGLLLWIAAFALSVTLNVSPLFIIPAAGITGIILYRPAKPKEKP